MAKVFLMLNPTIKLGMSKRFWYEVGDTIYITTSHLIHISRIRFIGDDAEDENQLILTEFVNGQQAHVHTIKNGKWLLLPTRLGYIEIIPKAISFNHKGDVDRLLVDLLETPAQGSIHARM